MAAGETVPTVKGGLTVGGGYGQILADGIYLPYRRF